MASTQITEERAGRGRLPYNLKPIVEFVRDNSREIDIQLEDVTATVIAALTDDGLIDEDEAKDILQRLIKADRGNNSNLHALNLLVEAGLEPALREVERVEAKWRKGSR